GCGKAIVWGGSSSTASGPVTIQISIALGWVQLETLDHILRDQNGSGPVIGFITLAQRRHLQPGKAQHAYSQHQQSDQDFQHAHAALRCLERRLIDHEQSPGVILPKKETQSTRLAMLVSSWETVNSAPPPCMPPLARNTSAPLP